VATVYRLKSEADLLLQQVKQQALPRHVAIIMDGNGRWAHRYGKDRTFSVPILTMCALAGRLGDRVSLGFVVETERQVEAHLQSHLDTLPAADHASRAIVSQMQKDEASHAADALRAGAVELPAPVRGLMRAAAKVMTTTAHHI